MAFEQIFVGVIGKADVAVKAFCRITAFGTHDKGRISSSVQKQNCLISLFNSVFKLVEEPLGQKAFVSASQLFCHVHDFHFGKRPVVYSVFKLYKKNFVVLCLKKSFHRRCCRAQHQFGSVEIFSESSDVVSVISRIRFTLIA